jgi:type I restriction enzyme S subunit
MADDRKPKEQQGLPEGWKWVRLEEVCFLSYGKNLPKDKFKDDGKYKVYGANGVIGFYDRYTHSDLTVLVSCRGEYSGFINIAEPYSFITNNSIPLLIKNQKTLDTIFLYYVLKNVPRSKIVSGSAQPQVVISDLKDIFILNPPLPEQRKIAQILETVDNAIEKTEKIIEKYKRIKQGLMQDLLTKGIDENGNIRSEKTHKFKDSPIGRIPEEWEVVRLGEVAKITTGNSNVQDASDDGVYPFFDRSGEIKRSERYFLDTEAVIVPGEGSDFFPKYFKGKFDLHQRTYAIFNFKGLDGRFLYYLMHLLRVNLIRTAVGTTVLSLRLPHFQNLEFPLPPLSEQKRIAEILSQIDQAIEKEEKYKQKLERLKKGLMEDLLTGKVRVNKLLEGESHGMA